MSYKSDLPAIKAEKAKLEEARLKLAKVLQNLLKIAGVNTVLKPVGESYPKYPDYYEYNGLQFPKEQANIVDRVLIKAGFRVEPAHPNAGSIKNGYGRVSVPPVRSDCLIIFGSLLERFGDSSEIYSIIQNLKPYNISPKLATDAHALMFNPKKREALIKELKANYKRLNDSLYKSDKGLYIIVTNDKLEVSNEPIRS